MDYISLILYIVGLLGICLSILMIGSRFHDKNKLASIFTLLVLFLSIISFGGGTIIRLIDKKSAEEDTKPSEIVENVSDKNDTSQVSLSPSTEETNNASLDDIIFEYNIKNNICYIDIKNTSAKVFNGSVNINILDSSNKIISDVDLPVNNLMPNNLGSYNILATNATDIDYKLNGIFSDTTDTTKNYSILSMGFGKGYIRFEVIAYDQSTNSLSNICRNFKNQYTKDKCSGFLIYFLNQDNESFDNSFAEYYRNNEGNTSSLIIYNNNQNIDI